MKIKIHKWFLIIQHTKTLHIHCIFLIHGHLGIIADNNLNHIKFTHKKIIETVATITAATREKNIVHCMKNVEILLIEEI